MGAVALGSRLRGNERDGCGTLSMTVYFRSIIPVAVLLAALLGAPSLVAATYPERPVTIVVPFAPGGANDVVIRAIQQPLAEALGQPIVVENRGGAGGSVGAGYVARARNDGYTLLMAATGFVVNPSLYDRVQYDPLM